MWLHSDQCSWHTYFASPDYLAVQHLICVTFLYPDTIYPIGPHVYHYTKFFEGLVGYTPLGIPCTRCTPMVSFANPVMPYISFDSLPGAKEC